MILERRGRVQSSLLRVEILVYFLSDRIVLSHFLLALVLGLTAFSRERTGISQLHILLSISQCASGWFNRLLRGLNVLALDLGPPALALRLKSQMVAIGSQRVTELGPRARRGVLRRSTLAEQLVLRRSLVRILQRAQTGRVDE